MTTAPHAEKPPVPRSARQRRAREYHQPRLSILHVLNRVRMRMLEIQVWDVAGTMTFYMLLSLFPGAVAVVSIMSMIGVDEQTLAQGSLLITQVFPTFDPSPYVAAIRAVSTTTGGVTGLLLGVLGSLLSASNGLAAFHRTLHRVYDTREGRPFLKFRLIVFGETLLLTGLVMLVLGMLIIGPEASQQLGEAVGIPRIAFEAWNLVKWPILLVLLIIAVSLAYYHFPNVRLPRYRLMTLGSTISVLVLFNAALGLGQLMASITRFAEVLTVLNGLIGTLLLLWLANIVIIGGAALDAEFLRARQIASGLDAWHTLVLEPQATHTIDFLARDAAESEHLGRLVAETTRGGPPLRRPRSLWIVESRNPLAVNPPRHTMVTSPSRPGAAPAAEDARPGAPASPAAPAASADDGTAPLPRTDTPTDTPGDPSA